MIEETFPHTSEDGYHIYGGWKPITYTRLYKDQESPLPTLIPGTEQSTPVSNFTVLIQRLYSRPEDHLLRLFLYYENSLN